MAANAPYYQTGMLWRRFITRLSLSWFCTELAGGLGKGSTPYSNGSHANRSCNQNQFCEGFYDEKDYS